MKYDFSHPFATLVESSHSTTSQSFLYLFNHYFFQYWTSYSNVLFIFDKLATIIEPMKTVYIQMSAVWARDL